MNSIATALLLTSILFLAACSPAPAIPTSPPATASPSPTAIAVSPTALPATVTAVPSRSPTAAVTPEGAAPPPNRPPTVPPPPLVTRVATPFATASQSASPTSIPTISVTLPITEWKVSTLLVGPGSPGPLYALQQGNVLGYTPNISGVIGSTARLLVSNDFGTTWRSFAGGLPVENPVCLHGLTMDYARADALYASTCQGIFRWDGARWNRFSEQKVGALAITYGKPQLMWATGYGPGPYILRSEDGGVTWQRADTDLVTFNGMANIAIDPRDGKTVYGMINPKYAGSYLRRGDASGRWVTMPVPDQGYTYIGMTIDGATGALYVATMQNNRHWQLWRSPNPSEPDLKQVRWEMVHDFGEASVDNWVFVLSSGSHPQGLALFVRLDVGNCSPLQGIPCTSVVQRSLDGGKSWNTVPVPTN